MTKHRLLAHVRANVIGYVALFLALGGVAWAASDPLLDRRGSVESKHIGNGEVRGRDLAPRLRDKVIIPPADGEFTGDWGGGQLKLNYANGEVTKVIFAQFPLPGVKPCTGLFAGVTSHTVKGDQYVSGNGNGGQTIQLHISYRNESSVTVLQGAVTQPQDPTNCPVPSGLIADL